MSTLELVARDILYRSKSRPLNPLLWKQHFCVETYYNWKEWTYCLVVMRYIKYQGEVKHFVNYHSGYLSYSNLNDDIMKPFLLKYGFRIKHFRILKKHKDKIKMYYDIHQQKIHRILSSLGLEHISSNIIGFLK